MEQCNGHHCRERGPQQVRTTLRQQPLQCNDQKRPWLWQRSDTGQGLRQRHSGLHHVISYSFLHLFQAQHWEIAIWGVIWSPYSSLEHAIVRLHTHDTVILSLY